MPRTPRLDFPGARHHVMNRAPQGQALFADDDSCVEFLAVLGDVFPRFGAHIHGYALMSNHYHLMVEVPEGNLSKVMRYVGATFTQANNRRLGRDGSVFRGRFHNKVVTDDAYWMHLLAYLHLNPVRAQLVKRPQDAMWSSHGAYIGTMRAPDFLFRDELLALFGSAEALRAYVEEVWRNRRAPPTGFDEAQLWLPSTATHPQPPQRSYRTYDQALADVARVMGIPKAKVLERPRGRHPNV